MTVADLPHEKRMRLRYAGRCRVCGVEIPARTEAIFERPTRTVRCVDCAAEAEGPTRAEIDPGVPGASARREFERRRDRREDRIRRRHPRIGGLILAMSNDPQTTRAWDTGAVGEEQLGGGLDKITGPSVRILHDRRIPGSRANIDHLAVTANGVVVIDAKRYRGRPSLAVEGGLVRPRVERLLVGRRDCSTLVDGVLKQTHVVRRILDEDVIVSGVLCFVEADWPLVGGSFTTRGVDVLWPTKLYPRLVAEGPLDADSVEGLHHALAKVLPAAVPRKRDQ